MKKQIVVTMSSCYNICSMWDGYSKIWYIEKDVKDSKSNGPMTAKKNQQTKITSG